MVLMTGLPLREIRHPRLPQLLVREDGQITGPSGRVLKAFSDKRGYLHINTYTPPKIWRQHSVAALVCETFHGPRPPGMHAAHTNGVSSDNRANNLRWATQEENEADKLIHGTRPMGETHPMVKLTVDDVRIIRKERAKGVLLRVLAERFDVRDSTISRIARRQSWGHIA